MTELSLIPLVTRGLAGRVLLELKLNNANKNITGSYRCNRSTGFIIVND